MATIRQTSKTSAFVLLLVLLAQQGSAQTQMSSTLGLNGDEDNSVGAFGSLDLLFNDSDWLSGSLGVNRPTQGFEDSRSLSAALDYGHMFEAWSVSTGIALGDREGFSSKKLRAGLQWQSEGLLLGAMLEESRVEATTYIRGINRILELEDDFSVSGAGARAGYYAASGLSFDLSFMAFDEPAGARFLNVDQLTERLLRAEVGRLVADGRFDRVRVENRIGQMQTGSYSNSTSVLSDSVALSLGYNRGSHQFGVDYFRDTYALADADMNTWDVRGCSR